MQDEFAPVAAAQPGPYVLAISKALAILEAFLDGSEALSLSEISRRAGMSRSTCHRLLATLEHHHFVERTGDGRHRLGLRLFQLGALVSYPNALGRLAEPAMTKAADLASIGCFLSVRDGDRSLCIARVDRGHIILAPYLVGQTLPLHVGAAPLILLAAARETETERILARPLEQLTPETEVDPDRIRSQLGAIRNQGFAIARRDDLAIGISAVGAPIKDAKGEIVAAVSLSGLGSRIHGELDMMLPIVRLAGAEISRRLGWMPSGEPLVSAADSSRSR